MAVFSIEIADSDIFAHISLKRFQITFKVTQNEELTNIIDVIYFITRCPTDVK